ncbi:hypothetical protein L218DRAFT_946192 [Marasmius fiardii PR-910]|nr:hypothetical protein L218DRAFT_946192 [Marasmius fiardii PR-910]
MPGPGGSFGFWRPEGIPATSDLLLYNSQVNSVLLRIKIENGGVYRNPWCGRGYRWHYWREELREEDVLLFSNGKFETRCATVPLAFSRWNRRQDSLAIVLDPVLQSNSFKLSHFSPQSPAKAAIGGGASLNVLAEILGANMTSNQFSKRIALKAMAPEKSAKEAKSGKSGRPVFEFESPPLGGDVLEPGDVPNVLELPPPDEAVVPLPVDFHQHCKSRNDNKTLRNTPLTSGMLPSHRNTSPQSGQNTLSHNTLIRTNIDGRYSILRILSDIRFHNRFHRMEPP